MFTSFDKALTALVMALLYFGSYFHVFTFGVSAETIQSLIVSITPFLVYFFPNKAS